MDQVRSNHSLFRTGDLVPIFPGYITLRYHEISLTLKLFNLSTAQGYSLVSYQIALKQASRLLRTTVCQLKGVHLKRWDGLTGRLGNVTENTRMTSPMDGAVGFFKIVTI
jgi:hypothetical protein